MTYDILIVDDEPDVRRVLSEIVKGAGWNAIEAGDGEQAIDRIKQGGIDLVILDIMMPQMDGLEAAHEMRKLSRELPIIVVTVKDDDTTKKMARKLYGVEYFITKPFPNQQLVEAVKKVLQL